MYSPGAALGDILGVGLVNYVNIKSRYDIVCILMSKKFQFLKLFLYKKRIFITH